MISTLKKLCAEPQAAEQPLDLSVPENKMMLAFYLAAPEVENDRRALNVLYGMRRAMKEGRWMGPAPIGYVNKASEEGRKQIARKEPEASLIQWAFEQLAHGTLAADQIRQCLNKKGLKCGRSNFWRLVRNPVYCGKIFVPRFKDEESRLVDGQHEPLVSEALFYQVQDVLDGKKRQERPSTKTTSSEHLPLRGYLVCHKCGRMLTGSASKGKKKLYHYYHCVATCGCRYRADRANTAFVEELKRYKPNPGVEVLYRTVITTLLKEAMSRQQSEQRQLSERIGKQNEKINKARELLLEGSIDSADYRAIKKECEDNLNRLEAKLTAMVSGRQASGIDRLLDKAVSALSNLDKIYSDADTVKKREIIGSIYPEKLCFDGEQYRTPRVNEAVRLIYLTSSELQKTKNRKSSDVSRFSGMVVHTGIEPVFHP